jgi:hypothetical protein
MKTKLTLFASLILFSITAAAQQGLNSKAFGHFVNTSDSLRNMAYKNKDANTYAKLVLQFENEYNKANGTVKRIYKANYNSAWYNLACVYAINNDKKAALQTLEKSIGLGFIWYTTIMQDSDMNNVRAERHFAELVNPLRQFSDYLYLLKRASKYNTADQRVVPRFTYQSANNPNLVALRKAFRLDSVAGLGTDVLRIINLMYWIHNLIPHDGQHDNPSVRNAMSMIAVCKKEGRGLNCRGLATVLNECYLSLGFKSRFVTCLPKDSLKIDNDCHVINMVFAPSLHKWIWIDPTNDAYVMDETGTLLGIDEVRERLVTDKPLIVNPDANWNHKQATLKKDYLYNYMAKNLYLLECPVNSEYDTETMTPGKRIEYIELLPLDYFKQQPNIVESQGIQKNTSRVFYKTNNPNTFWQLPGDADKN